MNIKNKEKKREVLILGLGNEILSDDGLGPRLSRDLVKMVKNPDVNFESASAGGLEIMEYIRDYEKGIFIDAVRTPDGKPGDVYHYRSSEFRETLHLSSLHDISFLTALKMGKTLNLGLPDDIHIIAIEILSDK